MSEFARLSARFGRFNLVGLMGAALQLVLLDLLIERFGLPGIVAAPIAVETAVLHNFFWHERFTWRDRGTGLRQIMAVPGRQRPGLACRKYTVDVLPLASAQSAPSGVGRNSHRRLLAD